VSAKEIPQLTRPHRLAVYRLDDEVPIR
jgi:hypothetical protein